MFLINLITFYIIEAYKKSQEYALLFDMIWILEHYKHFLLFSYK
jgi:hypothetical protein